MEWIQWNQVLYIDCLDKEKGLFICPSKSIDYCFTDPPFNVQYGVNKKFTHRGKGNKKDETVTFSFLEDSKTYTDKKTKIEYLEWCKIWFTELKRICNVIIIYCGNSNLNMWVADIEKPYGYAYLYQINGKSMGRTAYLDLITPILIYGKSKKRLKRNVFVYNAMVGWQRQKRIIHPCPLNPDFWYDLISQFSPNSVIDPFMGSGVTAEVCERLQIKKWVGYEIDQEYQSDINYRLDKIENQRKIDKYIKEE